MEVTLPEMLEAREGRKCLICGAMAQACARSRTHSVAQLQEKTRRILEDAVLQEGDWETLKTLVPPTTLDYFTGPEAAPVLERIRRAGNVVHY